MPAGFGATPVGPASRVLVYYTTYDPKTFATQPTLAIGAADATPAVGVSVTITVRQYDDAGVASIPGQAWVWTNGVGTPADGSGQVTVRFRRPGSYRLRATEPGAIRSRSLWVRVAS